MHQQGIPVADSSTSDIASRFDFVTDWQALDPQEGKRVAAFWKHEGALVDDRQIADRLPQLVMHVRDGDAVAAVCTAVPMTPQQFGQPIYFYRSFIGRNWRTTSLILSLTRRAVDVLERYAAAHDFACIGVLLELEAERFRHKGRAPVWPSLPFVYVGRSPAGLETRVYYFKGAKLKNPS